MSETLFAAPIPPEAIRHIEVTPGICGGKPRIAGTRIRVQDIVIWHERMSISADEIATRHPQVTLAAIYAALAFYHDHRAELDEQMRAGEQLVEEMRQAYPSKLTTKLQPRE
jgi:uncharacterized protein (DUF433 family)